MTTRGIVWGDDEFRSRLDDLILEGFTPEEAFEMSSWPFPLTHWMIGNLRQARRALISNLKRRGMSDSDIQEELNDRYLRLGLKGQYEDEEWYFDRRGAPVA